MLRIEADVLSSVSYGSRRQHASVGSCGVRMGPGWGGEGRLSGGGESRVVTPTDGAEKDPGEAWRLRSKGRSTVDERLPTTTTVPARAFENIAHSMSQPHMHVE